MVRWRRIGSGVAAVWCLAGTACDSGGGGGGDGMAGTGGFVSSAVALAPAFGGISFSSPVKLVQHPTDDDRWYVVEQGGRVRTFLATNASGTVATAANVPSADPAFVSGGEQGLLGLAFDPNFATSGEAYLTYTRSGTSILARWVSRDSGVTLTPDSAPVVLAFRHPFANHNGGDIVFGPDRFLYYSMGDGGGGDDPEDNGQNRNVLLGKMMRIDVNSAQGSDTYAVPADNPFAAGNAHCNNQTAPATHPCPEIWAYGLRNPWRMNFDPATGKLYVADVGQGAQDEIDIIVKGGNYGWDCVEGELDHSSLSTAQCSGVPFVPPEIVHGRSEANALIGGAVYRGTAIASLRGFYVYGDFVTQLFFTFDTAVANAPPQRLGLPPTPVTAFGQGRDGEIYVVGFGSPSIQKIVPGSG
ncbi:MAG TPA: PQQ-dependent sugar dehydrogenase [Myxococcota bacterium]|nr:PQQ-dependent sugar dehydrogenase [Myxococcota bacterium]